jgi:hypothetical protein
MVRIVFQLPMEKFPSTTSIEVVDAVAAARVDARARPAGEACSASCCGATLSPAQMDGFHGTAARAPPDGRISTIIVLWGRPAGRPECAAIGGARD